MHNECVYPFSYESFEAFMPECGLEGKNWNSRLARFTRSLANTLVDSGLTDLRLVSSFPRRFSYPKGVVSYPWAKNDQAFATWWQLWRSLDIQTFTDWTYGDPIDDSVQLKAMKGLLQGIADVDWIVHTSEEKFQSGIVLADHQLQNRYPRGYDTRYDFNHYNIADGIDVAEFSFADVWQRKNVPYSVHVIHEEEYAKPFSYRFGPHLSNKQNLQFPLSRDALEEWYVEVMPDHVDVLSGPTMIEKPRYINVAQALCIGLRTIRIELTHPCLVSGKPNPTISENTASTFREELARIRAHTPPQFWQQHVPPFRIAEIMSEGTVAYVTNPNEALRLFNEMGLHDYLNGKMEHLPMLRDALDISNARLIEIMDVFDMRK